MERQEKKKFVFHIDYFKESGKWYTSANYEYECATIHNGHPYMDDVVTHIQGLRDFGGRDAMPGLSGGWNGYITVRYSDSFPTLILAKKVSD